MTEERSLEEKFREAIGAGRKTNGKTSAFVSKSGNDTADHPISVGGIQKNAALAGASFSGASGQKEEKKLEEVDRNIRLAREFITQRSQRIGHPLTFHVTTFGCQMNAHDSEKLRGMLEEMGYTETDSEQADFVIYNTCSVRENANLKVYGRLGRLNGYKKKNPEMMIGLCGCMMQEKPVREKIKKSYRFVDLVFGTHNLYEMPSLVVKAFQEHKMEVSIYEDDDNSRILEELPQDRTYSFKTGFNIMYGCNNFCTYCIVPYVRGREYSRPPQAILDEIRSLAQKGVKEVMLLGQNVNSYGKTLEEPVTFAQLLKQVDQVPGIERVRFMTSHPKDLSDELIDVMASSRHVCGHLHLPVQSGSTRILEKMNRHYTKESYLDLVGRIRRAMPQIALTTDIIVGFPGETEEDFEETMDLVENVRYDNAFTFLYSVRTGTPAANMEGQVPEDVAKERFNRLLAKVQGIAAEKAEKLTGAKLPVLVESINRQDPSLVTGRLENNSIVHFPGTAGDIGQIVQVRLDTCKGFYYFGERV